MTCNQAITLLEIYRAGDPAKVACGTTLADLELLRRRGLIERAFVAPDRKVVTCPEEGDRWTTTALGAAAVQEVLDFLSR